MHKKLNIEIDWNALSNGSEEDFNSTDYSRML